MLTRYLLIGGLLIGQAAAYPWMAPGYDGPSLSEKDVDQAWKLYERYKENNEPRADKEKRILGLGETLGNVVGSVGGLLDGLLGGIAENINPSDQRPDAAHPFQAPGPSDQRGPCPGLNTLANHGYLPRSGIVTAGEVIEATAEGFNMGADLSGLLVFIAVAFGGNIESSTFSLGGEDDRTYSASGIGSREAGRQYGLAGHSRCEGDISAMRRDFYLNNGDNHNAYPDRFKRFIELAKENGGEFNLAAANALYGQNAQESVANNPQLFFNSYTVVVVLGEYPFIPYAPPQFLRGSQADSSNFFSNGTYGAGGVANYESISSFYGMSMNEDGTICYVPERFPDNWYRRSVPYGVVDLVAGLPGTYLSGPVLPNPVGILQNPAQAPNLGCAIYQGLTSGIPAGLLGSTNDFISEAVTYLQNNLLPVLPDVYGCKPDQPSLQANGSGGEQYNIPSGGPNSYNICA